MENTSNSLKKSPQSLQDQEAAARLRAFKTRLKQLSSSKGDDIKGVCTLDLSERITKIESECRALGKLMNLQLANSVHTTVTKQATKPSIGRGAALKLTAKSVEMILRLFDSILDQLTKGFKADAKPNPQMIQLSKRLVGTIATLCHLSGDESVWAGALNLARHGSRVANARFEDYLAEESIGSSSRLIQEGSMNALETLLQRGSVELASNIVNASRGHYPLEERINTMVQKLLREAVSFLPPSSQTWLLKQSGQTSEPANLDYTNPADAPEVKEAATLLLQMFDNKEEGGPYAEAYERFEALCNMHFRLFIRGTVGESTVFDERIHEGDSASGQVKMLRPWIEWYNPPNARVVIRALVQKES
jgi:hypothetical protein